MAHESQERYSSLVLAKLRKELVLSDGLVFNNDYEGDPTAGSVKIPVRDTEVAVSDYDKANGISATNGSTSYTDLVINKDKAVNEVIDGFDADSVPDNLVADRLDSAGYSLAAQIDTDGGTVLLAGATPLNVAQITKNNVYDTIVDVRKAMSDDKIPNDGKRYLLVTPFVIGDKAEKITDIETRTTRLIEYELPQRDNELLTSAKGIATDIINAGINGHVVCNGNELLIMDTADKTTATKVWRYNLNGWAVSHNGYSGPYTMAATLDGGIVADFITAGVLRGLEILNGNGKFHVHTDGSVDASAINITGGSINITTNSASYDVIQLQYVEGELPYQTELWSDKFRTYCRLTLHSEFHDGAVLKAILQLRISKHLI